MTRLFRDSRIQYYNLSGITTAKAGSLRSTAAGIRNGDGIAFIPRWHAERYGCRWFPLNPQVSYNFYYLYSSRRDLNESDLLIINKFRDHLK